MLAISRGIQLSLKNMNEEPRYNDIYYQSTTAHSRLIDIVGETETPLRELCTPIDWHAIFGNAQPVEIEIGSGKGRFLLEVSKRHPERNYLGVERAQKYVALTRERFLKYIRHNTARLESAAASKKAAEAFSNVRLVWTDATYFLTRYVPTESVLAYHIYFPDPWPKKRQRKRRIFRNQDFLAALARTLTPGGRLHIVTDYAAYFAELQERISQQTPLHQVTQASPDKENYIPTNFELKYIAEGRQIYRVVYEKR